MHERAIAGLLLVVAVIHLLPIIGVLGADRLSALYAINVTDNNLELLMRHRAVLFGIIGGLIAYAAFTPGVQPLAFVIAFVSIASFLYLALSIGDYNESIRRVVIADIAAGVALAAATLLYLLKPSA